MAAVSVVVPFRGDGAHRDRVWAWLEQRWTIEHPESEIVLGAPEGEEWCKAAAVDSAALRANGEVLIVSDADVWCDEVAKAVDAVSDGAAWAVPHLNLHRLDESSTSAVLDGGSFTEGTLTQSPYRGHAGGGIVVLPAALLREVPLDRRFVGWGSEDDAWAVALTTLAGRPWRGKAPLWHLWHQPQPRRDRRVGSEASFRLFQRYQRARREPDRMRALIEESRWPCESRSTAPP